MAARPGTSPAPQAVADAGQDGPRDPDPHANGTLLYHQTIIPTQGISHCVKGSFTLPGSPDVVLVRHNVLELWTLHMGSSSGGGGSSSAECIHSCPLFANVLAAAAVPTGLGGGGAATSASFDGSDGSGRHGGAGRRATGSASLFAAGGGYDYLVVTSETGYATLLRYELAEPPVPTRTSFLSSGSSSSGSTYVAPSLRGRFVKVSEACLGRSGVRLTVPGARIAVDPSGGALMITSLMRNKVVLPLRRTNFGLPASASSSLSPSPSSSAGSALGWLGAGSSLRDGACGVGGDGLLGSEDDDDNDNEHDPTSASFASSPKRRGGAAQEEGAVGRQLARKRRRLAAPRGVITFGSAIEAHRETVLFSCCALDGFVETSAFAVLEQETGEAQEQQRQQQDTATAAAADASPAGPRQGHHPAERPKYLVVYAYVPSLHQVQRTHLVRVPASAHRLVAVPAAPYGPGGVLVCTDVEVVWYDLSPTAANGGVAGAAAGAPATTGVFKCAAPLPRRMAFTETLYDPSIIADAVTRVRSDFFLLLQDEHGDLFRVALSSADVQRAYDALKAAAITAAVAPPATPAAPHVVNPLSVHYFDTIAPVSDMVLFPRGFLLAGTEAGPFHGLYKIVRDGYTRDSEYIVKRVKRVREVAPAAAPSATASAAHTGAKRSREDNNDDDDKVGNGEGHVKKEEPHDVDERKPKVTGKLLALLQQQPLPSPPATTKAAAAATQTTITRVIAIYQPHHGLKHLALVQTYPNTPPVVGFTAAIPMSGGGGAKAAGEGRSSVPAPAPPGAAPDASTAMMATPAAAPATASSQPQMQFNLVAGRGAGSVLLSARFGYATRREGRFALPFASEAVFPVLSAVALQRLVLELSSAVAQAQRWMDASNAILGTRGDTSHGGAATAAARSKTVQKLLATSRLRESQLWTDKLLVTTSQGTTAPYHVGRTMEPDWWTGFVTAERTLAVATLKYGIGYVQVTPRALYVLPPISREVRERERQAAAAATAPPHHPDAATPSATFVQPTTWTHRHGKMILAAAATPTTVLVTFTQGGGVASFSFGLTGTQLEQTDDLPTFPPSPAVSLLQPSPASLTGAAMDAQLNAFLFGGDSAGGGRAAAVTAHAAREERELAAVATIAQEVYLVDPRKLREPMEKINCKDVGVNSGTRQNTANEGIVMGEDGSVMNHSQSGAIVSVLLTYLGGDAAGGGKRSASGAAASAHSAANGKRLFCFIGHMNGMLTRCELDPATARVVERDELTCGTAPCKLIAGDGQSVCYVQSGVHAWRCEVRDGVAKVVPWRFPSRQQTFAAFLRPSLASTAVTAATTATKTAAQAAGGDVVKQEPPPAEESENGQQARRKVEEAEEGEQEEQEEEHDGDATGAAGITFITATGSDRAAAASGGLRDECVVALAGNELTLFSAQKSGTGASSLEYSFTAHNLPLAGRRILQHTTRPSYFILLSTEHRGYSMADIKRMRADRQQLQSLSQMGKLSYADGTTSPSAGPIPLDAPQRALGRADVYNSTLQLFHEEGNRVLPRYFFPEGEAVLCGAVGSFVEDFGKEPVVVVGAASQFTHGAGCGIGAGWTQGWLCAFRFTTQPISAAGGVRRAGEAAVLRIEPLHRTVIRSDAHPTTGAPLPPDYPSAVHICEDVGLLFVGLGEEHGLRIYAWGQQQFLRRRHLPGVPSRIVAIETAWVAPPPGAATTTSSSNFLSDLYHVPFSNPAALKRAREQRLLVFCATTNHSVIVASLQSGAGNGGGGGGTAASPNSTPSFLMIVARDAVPRQLTATLVVLRDGRTAAVADRFGNVTFLRVPLDNRNGFSLPVADMRDAQLAEAEAHISQEQFLEEVASHATGQLVTSLQRQPYDPSNGADPSLAIEMVVYSTALGAVGAYVPFVSEADASLAAYAQPLLAAHMRTLVAPHAGALPVAVRGHLTSTAGTVPGHHVIEGDLFHVFRHQQHQQHGGGAGASAASQPPFYVTSSVFTAEAKTAVEEELKRARHVEAARRKVLGLPARELPELSELIAKQRALASLPQ